MQHPGTCNCARRSFLKGCGLTLTGVGLSSLFPTPFIQHALAGLPGSDRRLLFLFLRGGNDGLNTVIPHGDAQYNVFYRPTLYIAPGAAIDLNGFASLHPALQDMLPVYNAGELAVVHRVGYTNSSLSHFDGQRIWENGDPTETQLFEGWLYRYIHENMAALGFDLPVLSVQPQSPLLLRGAERFVNVANPDSFEYVATGPTAAKLAAGWLDAAAGLDGIEPYRPILSQTGVKLADTLDEYDSWDQASWNPLDPVTGFSLFPVSAATNQKGFSSASYGFFRSLKVCALALLESDGTNNGTRVAGTELGGFDLHDQQGQATGAHAALLKWLAYGYHALYLTLSGQAVDPRNYASIWDKTTVVTLSEFGRTTIENGNKGTDHAAASCLFIAGGPVNGGVYNCDGSTWPNGVMFGVDGRYLLHRTDYRAIFWEILRDHMGASPATADLVFPNYTSLGLGGQELGLIAT